jgi:hypothetical protein
LSREKEKKVGNFLNFSGDPSEFFANLGVKKDRQGLTAL